MHILQTLYTLQCLWLLLKAEKLKIMISNLDSTIHSVWNSKFLGTKFFNYEKNIKDESISVVTHNKRETNIVPIINQFVTT